MEAILIRNAEALTEGDEIVGKVPQDQGVFSQTFLEEPPSMKTWTVPPPKTVVQDGTPAVNQRGHVPDETRVTALRQFPLPTTKTQLLCYISSLNYYRCYIQGFANMASSLYSLTGTLAPAIVAWTEETKPIPKR